MGLKFNKRYFVGRIKFNIYFNSIHHFFFLLIVENLEITNKKEKENASLVI